MTESRANLPNIVSRDEWLAARKELLAKEKGATRTRSTKWRPQLSSVLARTRRSARHAGASGES